MRLTPSKQDTTLSPTLEHLAQCLASGMSQIDAYCTAFGHDKNCQSDKRKKWYREKASMLANSEDVLQRVDVLRSRMGRVVNHDPSEVKRFVIDRLYSEAERGDTSSARIKACELLGKMSNVGLFTERVEQTTTIRTPDQIKTELEQRLRALSLAK